MKAVDKKPKYLVDWSKVKTVEDLKAIFLIEKFHQFGTESIRIRSGTSLSEALADIRSLCVDD